MGSNFHFREHFYALARPSARPKMRKLIPRHEQLVHQLQGLLRERQALLQCGERNGVLTSLLETIRAKAVRAIRIEEDYREAARQGQATILQGNDFATSASREVLCCEEFMDPDEVEEIRRAHRKQRKYGRELAAVDPVGRDCPAIDADSHEEKCMTRAEQLLEDLGHDEVPVRPFDEEQEIPLAQSTLLGVHSFDRRVHLLMSALYQEPLPKH